MCRFGKYFCTSLGIENRLNKLHPKRINKFSSLPYINTFCSKLTSQLLQLLPYECKSKPQLIVSYGRYDMAFIALWGSAYCSLCNTIVRGLRLNQRSIRLIDRVKNEHHVSMSLYCFKFWIYRNISFTFPPQYSNRLIFTFVHLKTTAPA